MEMVYDKHKFLVTPFRSALINDRAKMYSQNIMGVGEISTAQAVTM